MKTGVVVIVKFVSGVQRDGGVKLVVYSIR
jgi:hypothetical protein